MSRNERVVQYLQKQLHANPVHEAERIIERRAVSLGLKQAATNADRKQPDAAQREAALQLIQRIREQFWSMPLETLRQQLSAVDLRNFPELKAAGDRLLHVATYRPLFAQLAQHKHFNPKFFGVVKQLVVLPPREAGALKDDVLRSLASHDALTDAKRMAKTMKAEFQQIYELDTEWFDSIIKLKKRASPVQGSQYAEGDGEGCAIPSWAIVIAVITILRLLARLSSFADRN